MKQKQLTDQEARKLGYLAIAARYEAAMSQATMDDFIEAGFVKNDANGDWIVTTTGLVTLRRRKAALRRQTTFTLPTVAQIRSVI